MIKRFAFLLAVVAASSSFGDIKMLKWIGFGQPWDYGTFSDSFYWSVATNEVYPYEFAPDDAAEDVRNPNGLLPDATTGIYLNEQKTGKYCRINMDGTEQSVKFAGSSFAGSSGRGAVLGVTNGVLNLIGAPAVSPLTALQACGGTIAFPKGSRCEASWGQGAGTTYEAMCGGCLVFQGALYVQYLALTIGDGAFCYFDPSDLRLQIAVGVDSKFTVRGTFEAPNGIVWKSKNGSSYAGARWFWDQYGKLILGGDVTRNGVLDAFPFKFRVYDGTTIQVVSNDVAFADLTEAVFKANAGVTLDVAADASLDISAFTAESGVSLVKTGAGTLKVGAFDPPALAVDEGSLALDGSVPSHLALSSGTTVRAVSSGQSIRDIFTVGTALSIEASEIRVDAMANLDDVAVTFDPEKVEVGTVVFRSADADVLSGVKDKLTACLPAGTKLTVSGDGLRYVAGSSKPEFDATACDDLGDLSGWGGRSEVPVGEEIVVRGAGTVRFTTSTPSFASITVQDDATLQAEGGETNAPVVLPPIALNYSSVLRLAESAYVVITNGLETTGSAQELPVFEIATNAIGWMTAPGYPNENLRFKNVDIRLYGQIVLPVTKYANNKGTSNQIFFGTADAGETAYFAMTAAGGSVWDSEDHSKSYVTYGNCTKLNFMVPTQGGTVIAVRDIVLRDFRKYPESIYDAAGYDVGVYNTAAPAFNLICEGTTLLVPAHLCRFRAGANVVFRDSARFDKTPVFNLYNLWGGTSVQGDSHFTFEDDAYWQVPSMTHEPFAGGGRGEGVYFAPDTDGLAVVTLRRGAHLDIWTSSGNGKGVAQIEDGSWDVGLRNADASWDPATPSGDLEQCAAVNSPAFSGFKAVNVAMGCTLSIRATDTHDTTSWRGWPTRLSHWDRTTSLAAPVTGLGNLLVTNTLTDAHTLTVTVTRNDNTATGMASAADTPEGPSYLRFASGANWAGTVVAGGDRVALVGGDEPSAPATVSFGSIRFDGDFPIRVWKDGDTFVCDTVNLSAATSGAGGFALVFQDGAKPKADDRVVLGTYPAEAALPTVATRHWKIQAEPIDGDATKVRLVAAYDPPGILLLVR